MSISRKIPWPKLPTDFKVPLRKEYAMNDMWYLDTKEAKPIFEKQADIVIDNQYKGIVDVGTGETNYITDLLQDETVPKQIGPDTERKDNKADTEVLYKYGWKNKHNIIDYINSERSKRIN